MHQHVAAGDDDDGSAEEVPSLSVRNYAAKEDDVVEQDKVGVLVHDLQSVDLGRLERLLDHQVGQADHDDEEASLNG